MTDFDKARSSPWSMRPWIMAAVGAGAGLSVSLLTDSLRFDLPIRPETALREAAAAAVLVAAIAFMVTAERVRLGWAVTFALGWGAVTAFVGQSTASYNRAGEMAEYPFLAALLAVAIAAPLFQTLRDEGGTSLPYDTLHGYAWTDAIIGAASLVFTGLTFLLFHLVGSLFDAIGIDLLKRLLRESWFGWTLAGVAFGTASAILRERAPLLGTLQRLVMLVFSVLAPVLAFALAAYLVALPITGFTGLWRSGLPATPLLLSAAAFCFVFLNAIVGDSEEDRKAGALWRITEGILLFAVLPLAVLALVSMSMRVSQYGWTPERLWGVIAAMVAMAFGGANWLAVLRRRGRFDRPLRDYQKRLAAGLCGVALLLALPIVDFGAISTRSQLARLDSGRVQAVDFDWTALAFDFGPAGRNALEELARSGRPDRRALASDALSARSRYAVNQIQQVASQAAGLRGKIKLLSPDIVLDERLLRHIAATNQCRDDARCALQRVSPGRLVLLSVAGPRKIASARAIDPDADIGKDPFYADTVDDAPPAVEGVDLDTARVELRTVTRRQLFVDGKPVGRSIE